MLIEILVTLGIVLLIYQIIWSVSVNTIIFNLGSMRYYSCLIATNVRSLDLMSRNFTLAYSESTYRNSIYTTSLLTKTYLNQYKTISIPLTNEKMRYFDEVIVDMFAVKEDSIENYKSTLFDAVNRVVEYSLIISNTSLENFEGIYDEFLFLYRNVPCDYIKVLNETVMSITNQ